MFIYFFYIPFSIYCMYFAEKRNCKTAIFFAILFISFFGGMRYGIGTDYFNYEKIYYSYLQNGKTSGFNVEVLFKFLMQFAYFFRLSFEEFIFFSQLLTNIIFYKAIENKKSEIGLTFPWAIYCFRYYLLSFNIIRQVIAMAFCLLAFTYYNKKFLKYLFFTFIGIGFHNSAIICLLPAFTRVIFNKKNRNFFYFLVLLFCFICVVRLNFITYLISLIFPAMNYINYFGGAQLGNGGSIYGYLFVVIPAIFPMVLFKKKILINPEYNFFLFIYLLGFVFTILNLYSSNQLGRITYYFTMIHIFLLPYICKLLVNKYNRIFITSYSYFLTFFMFLWDYFILNNGEIRIYKNILWR